MSATPRHAIHLGTQKAGSTYLLGLVRQYPEFRTTTDRQELHYFANHFDQPLDWYFDQFKGDGAVVWDNSPAYFRNGEVVAERIGDFVRGRPVLLSLLLRDPISYLHSLHQMRLRQGTFERTGLWRGPFEDLVKVIENNPGYIDSARYADQLERIWFPHAPRDLWRIGVFEEFIAAPLETLADLRARLVLPPGGPVDLAAASTNPEPKWRWVHAARTFLAAQKGLRQALKRLPMAGAARKAAYDAAFRNAAQKADGGPDERTVSYLKARLAPDVERLRQLLGRETLPWKHFRTSGEAVASPGPSTLSSALQHDQSAASQSGT